MYRIYHYHHYAVLAFGLTYQVLDNGYMSIYQLLGQVHNIQLLVCFFKHFHISALIEDIECP